MVEIGQLKPFQIGINTVFLRTWAGRIILAHEYGLEGTKITNTTFKGMNSNQIFPASKWFGRTVGMGRGKHWIPKGGRGEDASEMRLGTGFPGTGLVQSKVIKYATKFNNMMKGIVAKNAKEVEVKKYPPTTKSRGMKYLGRGGMSIEVHNTIPLAMSDLHNKIKRDLIKSANSLAGVMQTDIRSSLKTYKDRPLTSDKSWAGYERHSNIPSGIIVRSYWR